MQTLPGSLTGVLLLLDISSFSCPPLVWLLQYLCSLNPWPAFHLRPMQSCLCCSLCHLAHSFTSSKSSFKHHLLSEVTWPLYLTFCPSSALLLTIFRGLTCPPHLFCLFKCKFTGGQNLVWFTEVSKYAKQSQHMYILIKYLLNTCLLNFLIPFSKFCVFSSFIVSSAIHSNLIWPVQKYQGEEKEKEISKALDYEPPLHLKNHHAKEAGFKTSDDNVPSSLNQDITNVASH